MRILLVLFVLLVLASIVALVRLRSLRRPRAFPAWAAWILDNPLRRLLSSREHAIERSGIERGMHALEVGPGNGYLTGLAMARVGPEGSLACLDIQPAMLRKLRSRGIDPPPDLVCASASALPFRDGCFDLVFLVCVLGEVPDKDAALRDCRRVLRPGGTLAVTEALPDPDYVRARVLRRLAERAGFRPGERFGTWLQFTHRFVRP